jgi:hypothetical protein
VTLAEGNFDFNAAGMLPEKAGRTGNMPKVYILERIFF